MISDGADYNKVLQWHMQRFGRPMHKSKFYAHRKKAANTLAESHEKKNTHSYIRPNESEKQLFEDHLKIAILEKTESMDATKWTGALLKQFAEQERMRPEFNNLDGLKELQFTRRYWNRFLNRQQLCFSTRKSDAKPFTENELNQFRKEMDSKLMFYKRDDIFNCDESAWFYRETRGRIIVRKGEHLRCTMSTEYVVII